MLRWRALHPYNAIHAAAIGEPLDEARLRRTIESVLSERGLTGLVVDATAGATSSGDRRRRCRWRSSTAAPSQSARSTRVRGADQHRTSPLPALRPLPLLRRAGRRTLPCRHRVRSRHRRRRLDRGADRRHRPPLPRPRIAGRDAAARAPPLDPTRVATARFSCVAGARRWPGSGVFAIIATGRRSLRPRVENVADGRNGFVSFAVLGDANQALARMHARSA